MNIKELKELIANYSDEMLVVMSKDGEGNGFSPLADYSDQYVYVPDSTWSGEILGYEDEDDSTDFEEMKKEHGLCLVLWPTS